MNQSDFDCIINDRMYAVAKTLVSKGKEYAPGDDVLKNFKDGAKISCRSSVQVCCGYMLKHIVAIMNMAEGGEVNEALIAERHGDVIAYMLLLEALFIEQIQWRDNERSDS